MFIYIPTYRRCNKQPAYESIPPPLHQFTKLVVTPDDYRSYVKRWGKPNVVVCPAEGIAAKRQWILDNSESPKCFMIDDDLSFSIRESGSIKVHKVDETEFMAMYQRITSELRRGFCAVGISQRAGNNRVLEASHTNTRMNAAYAINCRKALDAGLRFDRLKVMEDFDFTLQMLAAGLENTVLYDFCWAQVSGATGGCSEYRTWEIQKEAAFQLAKMHPGLVTPVTKTPKSKKNGKSLFGTERWDVRIQWKKARARSQQRNATGFLNI